MPIAPVLCEVLHTTFEKHAVFGTLDTVEPHNIVTRWAEPEDQDRLLDLFLGAYGSWPKPEFGVDPRDHLRWKYTDIGVQSSRQGVAEGRGRLIGAIPLITRTYLVNGRPLQVATAADVAILPEYRSSGVMLQLQEFTRGEYRNSLDMNFGYEAPHPAMARARERIGNWGVMGHLMDILAAELDQAAPAPVDGNFTIDAVTHFDERFDAFCEAASRPFRLVPPRNAAYLNWRYCDPRAGQFTVLQAQRGSELLGYAALRVLGDKGYIADLLVLPDRFDVVAALASEALRRLRASGAARAQCWLPAEHLYQPALAAAGFSERKRPKTLVYEPLQVPEEELLFLHDPAVPFHLMLGDSDII